MKAAKPNKAATRRPYSKKKLLQKSPTAPLNATRAVRGGKKKKKKGSISSGLDWYTPIPCCNYM